MTIQRRTLLLSALAAFAAPAIVRAESLMKIKPTEIWTPPEHRIQVGDVQMLPIGLFVCTDTCALGPIWERTNILPAARYLVVDTGGERVYRPTNTYDLRVHVGQEVHRAWFVADGVTNHMEIQVR